MQTFEQCLGGLVNEGAVTFEVAKMNSSNPSDFELKMTMFSSTGAPKKMEAVAEVAAATESGVDAGMLEGIQTGRGFDIISSRRSPRPEFSDLLRRPSSPAGAPTPPNTPPTP